MPDISMCRNQLCESKNECYRYTAKPSPYWQSYMNFDPQGATKCESFWETDE